MRTFGTGEVLEYCKTKRFGGVHVHTDGDIRASYLMVDGSFKDFDLIVRPITDGFKAWLVIQPEGKCSTQSLIDKRGHSVYRYDNPLIAVDDAIRYVSSYL